MRECQSPLIAGIDPQSGQQFRYGRLPGLNCPAICGEIQDAFGLPPERPSAPGRVGMRAVADVSRPVTLIAGCSCSGC